MLEEESQDLFPIKDKQKLYWNLLILVGLYYLHSSLQFVYYQEEYGDDLCYFNLKCQHSLGSIKSFNNVISNIFYVLLGIVFLIIIKLTSPTTDNNKGLHKDNSLYYSIGIVLILEGFSSAIYHICPSKLNYQFDTTFMFIGASLIFLSLYQKRHQNKIPSAFKTFGFMWLIILANALSLTGLVTGLEVIFWIFIYVLILYILVMASINIYYSSDWTLDRDLPSKVFHALQQMNPYQYPKLIIVTLINLYSIIMVIYATVQHTVDFTDWLLALFVINMLMYFLYYIVCKIYYSETIKWYVMILLFIDFGIITTSLLFFSKYVSDKSLSHHESNMLNKPCVLFNYFDYHDIWHMFSAIGLFMFMIIVYIIDHGLDHVDRNEIHKF
jgi:hypothetical protein